MRHLAAPLLVEHREGTPPPAVAAMRRHAERCHPREMCGLLLDDGGFEPVMNLAAADDEFKLPDSVWIDYGERIAGIVHSHCVPDIAGVPYGQFPDAPSEADMAAQVSVGLAYGIVLTDGRRATGPFWWGGDSHIPPLEGRRWRHGVTDCYELVRDWYAAERGIDLPAIPRAPGWQHRGEDMIAGWMPVLPVRRIARPEEIERGDVLLFGRERPEDMAVYLGFGEMLTQYHDRLSRREPVARWMRVWQGGLRWRG